MLSMFEIVTDSSANLTDELIEQYQLPILSLTVRVEGQEYVSYVKGHKSDIKPIYDKMRQKKPVETSAANPGQCHDIFEELLKAGKDLLYIGFSSGLSGTYQTASMQLEDLRGKYPERKIRHVDSLAASMGEGLLVWHACQLREQGKSLDEVYQWVLENRLHLCHWFTVDDLFHLKRGGRISAATAVAGTMLGIKPVMHVDDEGHLVAVGKVKGRRASLNALVDHMEQTAIDPARQMIFISHGDCLEDAQYVEQEVKRRMGVQQVMINYVDPVIGAHSGPGTVALFFLGTKR
ncbi:MAG TPA: DegV family protein [Firmicutes bacterium]|nr:DegV family protein [Bacillota bacterium]